MLYRRKVGVITEKGQHLINILHLFLQKHRLNDQRCDPTIIAKTREEQFFGMIFHSQSKRMDDQRCEMPAGSKISQ
jgi:hypothetical protein